VSDLVLQGIACRFRQIIDTGNGLIFINPGALTSAAEVKLLLDHEGKPLASTNDRLEIHIGDKSLAFRYSIPDSWSEEFESKSDDFETYLPVSIGMTINKSEMLAIDGTTVKLISSATLNEISILQNDPAVKSAHARVVSVQRCGDLEDDCDLMEMTGRFISLHRKANAVDGVVRYAHVTSDYDRAADRFARALKALI
jgi:hypothetical protein